VPAGGADGDAERELHDGIAVEVARYTRQLEAMEFRKAAGTLRAIWTRGNAYFDHKAPWTTVKTDRDATAVTLRTSIALIALFARLSAPLLPATAERVLGALGLALGQWPRGLDTGDVVPGAPFEIPPVLFAKIGDDEVEGWRARFGGHAAASSEDAAA
jgi:methionyl-tRNA synthetase